MTNHTKKFKGRTHIHTTFLKDPKKDHTNVKVLTEQECLCRGRYTDLRRCSSQAFRSRESINEKADEISRRLEMMKACGINVQGTVPQACHIVPIEEYEPEV